MNKKITRIIFAVLVAVFVSGTVLLPAMTTVFAEEQTADQQQQTPPASDVPDDGGNQHSGHDSGNEHSDHHM
jgi:hypothetical protein